MVSYAATASKDQHIEQKSQNRHLANQTEDLDSLLFVGICRVGILIFLRFSDYHLISLLNEGSFPLFVQCENDKFYVSCLFHH